MEYMSRRINADLSGSCKTCKHGLEESVLFQYEVCTKFYYSDKESLMDVWVLSFF